MVYLTHGMSKTTTYTIWKAIHQRCSNPNNDNYSRYGARGIAVCARWCSFENFLSDMGERPVGMSIEREDNDKGYEPGNCRWATPLEQSRNRRDNRMITYQGVTLCVTDWAVRQGLPGQCLRHRLKKGWSLDKALNTPAGAGPVGRPRKHQVT